MFDLQYDKQFIINKINAMIGHGICMFLTQLGAIIMIPKL